MFKLLTVIGARPQIIKAAAVSRAVGKKFSKKIKEVIVHTGQHYDYNMSRVFFEEMNIPRPDYNLGVGSGSHGKQTASMISGIEEILINEKPDAVLLYGDTNSTLAGAVAASKLHIPVVHVEAGLRSFNKSMPEEINRILCDQVSSLLFVPTLAGIANLKKEGFNTASKGPCSPDSPRVFRCGDVMYDNSLYFSKVAEKKSTLLDTLQLEKNKFILATLHRDSNTDNPHRLNALFGAFYELTRRYNIDLVIPLHPRTSKLLGTTLNMVTFDAINDNPKIRLIPPVSYLEMTALEMNASLIMTDSGGVQKEAFFFRKPLIILRPETEWVELVKNGNAVIADANEKKILSSYKSLSQKKKFSYPKFYGDGKAAEFICAEILRSIRPHHN
jgi:UDP-GlcNAc3NAcA epimerase